MQADQPLPDLERGEPAGEEPGAANARQSSAPRMVHSTVLLAGRSQLAIRHNETVYFLRQTRFGKLILTK